MRETASSYTEQPADDGNEDYWIGARVIVNTDHQICNKLGCIRFIGQTHFRQGVWYGIELDEPVGESVPCQLASSAYFSAQESTTGHATVTSTSSVRVTGAFSFVVTESVG